VVVHAGDTERAGIGAKFESYRQAADSASK